LKNKIRELRKAKQLTQSDLANAVGTSQQQIQRIEGGQQEARFDLAVRICKALGEPMQKVFPGTAKPLERGAGRSVQQFASDEKAISEMAAAGVDLDASYWTFAYRLSGGHEGEIVLTGREKTRVWNALWEDEASFVVFDSVDRRYALAPRHLVSSRFAASLPVAESVKADQSSKSSFELRVLWTDSPTIKTVLVDGDAAELEDDAEEIEVQLQHLFFMAEEDGPAFFTVTDETESPEFLRRSAIAMLSVPLEAVMPAEEDDAD